MPFLQIQDRIPFAFRGLFTKQVYGSSKPQMSADAKARKRAASGAVHFRYIIAQNEYQPRSFRLQFLTIIAPSTYSRWRLWCLLQKIKVGYMRQQGWKRYTKSFAALACLGALVLGTMVTDARAVTLGTNLLQNGSFEQPNFSNPQHWKLFFPQQIPGWTIADNRYVELQERGIYDVIFNTGLIGAASKSQAHHGNQWAEIDYQGIQNLSQSIATTAGQQFELSFAYAPRPDIARQTLGIYWNDTLITHITAQGTSSPVLNWTVQKFLVQATSSLSTLSFGCLSCPSGGYGNLIDNVSLRLRNPDPSPIPEPATGILLTLAAAGALMNRKRV